MSKKENKMIEPHVTKGKRDVLDSFLLSQYLKVILKIMVAQPKNKRKYFSPFLT